MFFLAIWRLEHPHSTLEWKSGQAPTIVGGVNQQMKDLILLFPLSRVCVYVFLFQIDENKQRKFYKMLFS